MSRLISVFLKYYFVSEMNRERDKGGQTHLFGGGPPVSVRMQPCGISNLITLYMVKDAPL